MVASNAQTRRCRLCLVTPFDVEPAEFASRLDEALAGGDVASLIITGPSDAAELQRTAESMVPIAQARGVAALLHNDTRVAARAKADGVHVDTGIEDLRAAIATLRPKKIVGAGDLRSRHDALLAGEADPDYVFFGRLDGDTDERIFADALDLAAWWSELIEIPAIVMGGSAIASVEEASEARVEFVALCRAVWEHAEGPRAAVEEANRRLSRYAETVA